jgi:hypothetical protein
MFEKRGLSEKNNDIDLWTQFSLFEEKYNKKYETFIELEYRFQIFKENLQRILIHNLDKERKYTIGINEFSDLTAEEFLQLKGNNI